MKVSEHIGENEEYIRSTCENCDDVIIRPMKLGEGQKTDCLVAFIEVAVSNMMLEDSVVGKFINQLWTLPEEQMRSFVEKTEPGFPIREPLRRWRKLWNPCWREMPYFSWTDTTRR